MSRVPHSFLCYPYGCSEIFNTDQGNQFTSEEIAQLFKNNGINISMHDKGLWVNNVFDERLWRSVKYEEVYLKTYDRVADAKQPLGSYFGSPASIVG